MFDLEQHIRQWRSQFEDSPNYGRADIDELETHLQDEIEKLAESELSQEESFWIACHRLGAGSQLEMEYAKNNIGLRWRKRLSWALGGYVMIYFLALCRSIVSSLVYAVYNYLPAPENVVVSFISSFILAPISAIYGTGWQPNSTLSPYMAFNILWQLLLMGAIAKMIFSFRFRARFNLGSTLGRLVLLSKKFSNKILVLIGLLAFPFFSLSKLATQFLLVRHLGAAPYGSINLIDATMSMAWIIFLVLVFFALILQAEKQDLQIE